MGYVPARILYRCSSEPSNRRDDQELAVLCLHLLQAVLVYINTLMIQDVLDEPTTTIKLDPIDLRALQPSHTFTRRPHGRALRVPTPRQLWCYSTSKCHQVEPQDLRASATARQ